jgi:pSer/pThr/pTyr-binding forkhead associated (FHA) protein/ribosomal protein L40E
MIVCPNCNHQNPEGAVNCEACYTELPSMIACPHCGASILSDAVFCGSCGSSLTPSSKNEDENFVQPAAANNNEVQLQLVPIASATILQTTKTARLIHLQTNNIIRIPDSLKIINLGKPNEQFPPDIDVSGFPNSEIVSRIHARLTVEDDKFYIEDLGSSNGTYVNHLPLDKGDRHQLKMGDQISLGKEDKVTFLFEVMS